MDTPLNGGDDMVGSKTRNLRFWDAEYPLVNEGESTVLRLLNEHGKKESLFVKITRREDYPNGYGLEGSYIDKDGVCRKVNIVVYPKSPQFSGVVITYDMARNT